MVLRLFYDLMSQPCRALVIFLKANSIPFESKLVALRKGEHLEPEFSKLNPFNKVPVLEHNGFVLTESIAMIRYLSREFNVEDHWYPKDSKGQARVDEYLEWQHLNTRLFGSMVFREKVINPILSQKPVNNEKVEYYKGNFIKVLEDIEKVFLKDQPYICGNKISVADIFCACEIEQPLLIGMDPWSNVPKVKSWLDKVRAELEPHYSEAHKITQLLKKSLAEKAKL